MQISIQNTFSEETGTKVSEFLEAWLSTEKVAISLIVTNYDDYFIWNWMMKQWGNKIEAQSMEMCAVRGIIMCHSVTI